MLSNSNTNSAVAEMSSLKHFKIDLVIATSSALPFFSKFLNCKLNILETVFQLI